jgi:hypothetical protein
MSMAQERRFGTLHIIPFETLSFLRSLFWPGLSSVVVVVVCRWMMFLVFLVVLCGWFLMMVNL